MVQIMLNKSFPNTDIYLSPINKIPDSILDLPGSKSIANRVLLLAAVANGESIIHNVPDVAEDVVLMLNALRELGIQITKIDSSTKGASSYRINGCNGQFPNKNATIFCGNSGTTIRFLSAVLALNQGNYVLTGIERMKERPIKDLVAVLYQLDAQVIYGENEGYPPLKVGGFKDNGIEKVSLSGKISSQYLTGMLIALPLLKRDISIEIYDELISKPYIDITVALLKQFGCIIETNGTIYTIKGSSNLHAIEYTIEPDASSASYFLALGAISGKVTVNNLSKQSLQGDKNFAQVLALMGAKVEYHNNKIQVSSAKLKAIDINMEDMPDVAMTIAVIALCAPGTTKITGISSWKVKETDRLLAMYNELTKLGASVIITDDSIEITPRVSVKSNTAINTYNDHRMAMCFSLIAAMGYPVVIKDYQCVGKTFSSYFDLFKQICYL